MDKIELAICSLEMLRALMLFDPLTGEDISLDSLNRDNRELYDSADVAIAALREKAERERGCEYTLYNPADEGYDDGLFYQCTCGENYIDPAQAKEWDFCPHCGNSIRSKDTKMCIDCENAEYEGEAGHWCAKHICWVDDTTCFDGCKDFHARKLDGGGQDEPKGH